MTPPESLLQTDSLSSSEPVLSDGSVGSAPSLGMSPGPGITVNLSRNYHDQIQHKLMKQQQRAGEVNNKENKKLEEYFCKVHGNAVLNSRWYNLEVSQQPTFAGWQCTLWALLFDRNCHQFYLFTSSFRIFSQYACCPLLKSKKGVWEIPSVRLWTLWAW